MNIMGRNVILRAIEPEDLPLIRRWSNDPDICYRVGSWHFPSSMWHMHRWYERIQNDELNQRFAVDAVEHGLIGTANLMDINWKDRNALAGILLGDKTMHGKGYGTDTLMAIMRYAFEELGLQRLDATIIENNIASLRLFTQSCGWVEEGRQRRWYWRKDRYWDRVLVGITRDEYLALIRETPYWDANA